MIQSKEEHIENFIDIIRAIMYFSIDTKITKEQEEKLINTIQLSKRVLSNNQKDNIFIDHIEDHKKVKIAVINRGKAICTICDKTAEQIYKEVLEENE